MLNWYCKPLRYCQNDTKFCNASAASSANLMPREHFHSGILSQLDFTMILQSLSIKLVLVLLFFYFTATF
jgi:hypothetical protein